jgi:hypothetical protein
MAAKLGLTKWKKDHMTLIRWLRIKRLPNDYTLQRVMAISKALIMEILGRHPWSALSTIMFMVLLLIHPIPKMLLYRHLNPLGERIPLKGRIH